MKLSETILAVHLMADRNCKSPRKRLAEIRHLAAGKSIDRLRLAKAILDEMAGDDMAAPRRAMWTQQTKRLARETSRRHRVENVKE